MTVTVWGWDVLLALTLLFVVATLSLWRKGELTSAILLGTAFVTAMLWLGYFLGRWMP